MPDTLTLKQFGTGAKRLSTAIRKSSEQFKSINAGLAAAGIDPKEYGAAKIPASALENPTPLIENIGPLQPDEIAQMTLEYPNGDLAGYIATIAERDQDGAETISETLSGIALTIEQEPDEALAIAQISDRCREVSAWMEEVYDPLGSHQICKTEAMAILAISAPQLSATDAVEGVLKDYKAHRTYLTRTVLPAWRQIALACADPATIQGAAPYSGQQPTETAMAQTTSNSTFPVDDDCCDRIVDAISRLQEGKGTEGGGGAGDAALSSDFGKALDQQIYSSLGVPSLSGDTAMTMDRSKLVDGIFEGLNRTILPVEKGEDRTFVFNPARARALAPLDGGQALGAQGVVAESIVGLKDPILRNIDLLEPEICQCSDDEIADLKADIDRALDLLSQEARTSVGAFKSWAMTLLQRLGGDVISLFAILGIRAKEPPVFERFCEIIAKNGPVTIDWPNILQLPAIDRDIGFLGREKNDQAIATVFEHITAIADFFDDLGTFNRGPLLVRLRTLIDAIPSSVFSVRTALNLADVNTLDRNSVFLAQTGDLTGGDVIDLSRLLTWIEQMSNEWRARLLEPSLNARDLRWLTETLVVLSKSLNSISSDQFATINNSNFALGRRQLRELSGHLEGALSLATSLRDTIDDRLAIRFGQRDDVVVD